MRDGRTTLAPAAEVETRGDEDDAQGALGRRGRSMRRGLGLAAAVMLTGCATIVSDDDYVVRVTSSPNNIPVMVVDEDGDIVHTATTPFSLNVNAYEGYMAGMDYTLTGPDGATATLSSNFDEWYIGNIFFPILGGLLIDPLTGSMWEYPEEVHVRAVTPSAAEPAAEPPVSAEE